MTPIKCLEFNHIYSKENLFSDLVWVLRVNRIQSISDGGSSHTSFRPEKTNLFALNDVYLTPKQKTPENAYFSRNV
ncbi:hypothetical protein DERF_007046 [Dermatophagoides farinae]|uniref:Uncharacterized protein n=1 Tax=Dermatophagoides farinae TaxID=6954 RepID=A0A922I0I9_DERFA|nr:hypothetical protein DERF_007046 [Dermatophagoides farinae]